MSTVTKEAVLDALRQVQDPDLHKDIVALGFITRNDVSADGKVEVTINLTTPACPVKDLMKGQAEEFIKAIPGVTEVAIEMTAVVRGQAGGNEDRKFGQNIKHVIAISSGKGGVGKSTVTVNLAICLAKKGARVGILDCDVYGPDIPMMMGLSGEPEAVGKKLIPKERHGVKTMSIGYLLGDDKPVMWRGPMIHKLIEQFLGDVEWGELDYLLVDMPPGTGDAQLSLAQVVPLSGGVLVTTPQAVATFDVTKAIGMFNQVNVDVIGIVENMSGYAISGKVEGAAAGTKISFETGTGSIETELGADGSFETVFHIFGAGGAEHLSKKFGYPVISRIPLNPAIRAGGDGGDPVTVTHPESAIAKEFEQMAGRFAQRVAINEHKSLPVLQ